MPVIDKTTSGKALRDHISQFDQTLNEEFHTESIQSLMQKRAEFFDQLLLDLWCSYQLHQSNLSINAVGGYGRKTLHPKSDIDLAIISDGKISNKDKTLLTSFLTKLWDLGTDIGHSVRTIDESMQLAKSDITIATNLIDIRPLNGISQHASKIKKTLFDNNLWTSDAFYQAKKEEQAKRHKSAKNTALYLEPNLKNNPGGLRDVQTIHWIAQKHFIIDSTKAIKSSSFLTSDETSELLEAYDFVCRVRWALHTIAKRPQEVLLFEHQFDVAKFMRFGGEENAEYAIESMMGYLFRAMTRIQELNQMLSDSFRFDILAKQSQQPDQVIDDYFVVRDNLIEAQFDEVFIDKIQVLRVFLLIAEHENIKGIAPQTLRLLRQTRRSLLGDLSCYQGCRETFIKILKHPNGLKTSLSLMHRYGILASYSSHWEKIEGRMQYDMHNAYTIDEHTFKAVQAIDSFSDKANKSNFIYNIKQYVKDNTALVLATLCHHISGQQAVENNQLSAIIAKEFAEIHQLKASTIKLVAWLVANQELLVTTMQSQDIADPDVISRLAKTIGSVDKLNALYVFTVADMIATNEEYWNEWHECQLKQLYLSTRTALNTGIENIFEVRTLIRENKTEALNNLVNNAFDPSTVNQFWSTLPNHFFSGNNVDDITYISENILLANGENNLVFIDDNFTTSSTNLVVYTKDRPKLFVDIFNTLASAKLKVKDAQIMQAKDGKVLELIKLLDHNNEPITEDHRIKQIISRVTKAIDNQGINGNLATPRFIKHFESPPVVEFLTSNKKNKVLLKINTLDDPSYMEEICSVFSQRELTIHSAKISSLGECTENVFLVSKNEGKELDPTEQNELADLLMNRIA
ncbi:[protein-PII] uridylyltransferase [Thalassotalea sp. G2M2-11]|uniref:[protein-PII] uridylyltransferase n=1 Tax=Thalassotalea sp. G2M2-11 TaxID=2787627 RepID=UPI0019D231B9|nr:[protein-PII] uridylyltransferase [Thalassotalea sp. G2M2-11]